MAKAIDQAAEVPADDQAVDLPRGMPGLNAGGKGGVPASIKILIVVSVLLAMLGVAGTIALGKFKEMREERKAEKAAEQKVTSESKMPTLTQKDFEAPPLPAQALDDGSQEVSAPLGEGPGATGQGYAGGGAGQGAQPGPDGQYAVPAMSPQQQYAESLKQRRLGSPIAAEMPQQGNRGGAAQDAAGGVEDAMIAAMRASMPNNYGQASAAQSQQKSTLEASLDPVATGMSLATRLTDPSMTVTQGTILPCSLDTAMNSQLPGMVMCKLSLPVYSTDSRVVLLDRGTVLTGQYQGGQLKQGMNRIFVLWTRAETPQGVTVGLDSPATDGLGRAGVGGKVNNHFWQRFGAGMMLSVVDDGLAYATQRRNEGNTQNFQLGSTSDTAKDAAAIAVESSVNIPPTMSTSQGSVVNVFVARDLYFGGVYGLRVADR